MSGTNVFVKLKVSLPHIYNYLDRETAIPIDLLAIDLIGGGTCLHILLQ